MTTQTKKHVAIIGAGPAGLTAAHALAKAGIQVDVYEASDRVGGMSGSFELWDQIVDFGPHRFFSSDRRINELWLEIAEGDYQMVDRLTRIYYSGKFFFYPLKAFNALANLGIPKATACMFSYMKEKLSPTKLDGSFEAWVTSRFGKKLFEVFFKTYSEKLWGISCKELDEDFAAQRIKKLSLFEAIKNALLPGKTEHKTLLDQFAYPDLGSGMIYNRMAEKIVALGGNVYLGSPVEAVNIENGTAKSLTLSDESRDEDGKQNLLDADRKRQHRKKYDHIISSMPLTQLVNRIEEAPAEIKEKVSQLKFRNTILVYLNINDKNLFKDNWLYVHSPDLEMGRITNYRNWSPAITQGQDSSILCLEYWCNFEDVFWAKSEEELIALAKHEIRKTGLIGEAEILGGHVYKIPRCYPIYNRGYKDALEGVETYLSSLQNLSVIGRYGAFKYNNQDHSILMGLLAAQNIVEGTEEDLWAINTDYDAYQEEAIITKTGLQVQ